MLIQSGKAFWAKVVGNPVPGYDKTKKEWSFDLALKDATIDSKDAVKELRSVGLGRYIKNKGDDRGDFIHLKRNSMKKDPKDGTKLVPSEPIRIVDHHNEPWGRDLIGNGSTLNVSVGLNTNPGQNGKEQTFMSPIAIQVWDHKTYTPKDAFPTRESSNNEVIKAVNDAVDGVKETW